MQQQEANGVTALLLASLGMEAEKQPATTSEVASKQPEVTVVETEEQLAVAVVEAENQPTVTPRRTPLVIPPVKLIVHPLLLHLKCQATV